MIKIFFLPYNIKFNTNEMNNNRNRANNIISYVHNTADKKTGVINAWCSIQNITEMTKWCHISLYSSQHL